MDLRLDQPRVALGKRALSSVFAAWGVCTIREPVGRCVSFSGLLSRRRPGG
jgi:hypothetical protein